MAPHESPAFPSAALPFRAAATAFCRGDTHPPPTRPISLGMGEPTHPTPQFIKDALSGQPARPGQLPGHRRRRRRCARPSPAGCSGATALGAGSGHPGAAGQRFARGAVCVCADRDRPDARGALVVCPNPFYQIYEGAACWPAPRPTTSPSDPAPQFRRRLGQRARQPCGAHAAAVRVLARQPDRRGHAAGRLAASCSS